MNEYAIIVDHDVEKVTLLIQRPKPQYAKGQRLNSIREVYEACLAGHKIMALHKDFLGGLKFDFDDNFGLMEINGRCEVPSHEDCEYWEILE